MLSSLPHIVIKQLDTDKVLHTMSSSTWQQFAYFRTLVHDASDTNIIEVEFCDDIQPFWDFLKKSYCKQDLVDFTLRVKHYCIMFGMEENCLLSGRLDFLLTSAALTLCYSPEFIATYESFQKSPTPQGIESFVHNLHVRDKWKKYCIKIMHTHDIQDPRNYNKMKAEFSQMEFDI